MASGNAVNHGRYDLVIACKAPEPIVTYLQGRLGALDLDVARLGGGNGGSRTLLCITASAVILEPLAEQQQLEKPLQPNAQRVTCSGDRTAAHGLSQTDRGPSLLAAAVPLRRLGARQTIREGCSRARTAPRSRATWAWLSSRRLNATRSSTASSRCACWRTTPGRRPWRLRGAAERCLQRSTCRRPRRSGWPTRPRSGWASRC